MTLINLEGLDSTFADDTKIAGIPDCQEGCQSILWDIDHDMGGETADPSSIRASVRGVALQEVKCNKNPNCWKISAGQAASEEREAVNLDQRPASGTEREHVAVHGREDGEGQKV